MTASSSWNLGRYANLEEIGDRAFYGCSTMTDSVLSTKLTSIGASAFEGCCSLHTLWLQTETSPSFGAFSLGNMTEDFCIRVPDSQENDDIIYRDYLEKLTAVLGKKNAYQILDSFSDGAKDRQSEVTAEEETETENQEEAVAGGSENTEDNIPGEIEDVSEDTDGEVTVISVPEDTEDTSGDIDRSSEDQSDQDQTSGTTEQTGQDMEVSKQSGETTGAVQQSGSGE